MDWLAFEAKKAVSRLNQPCPEQPIPAPLRRSLTSVSSLYRLEVGQPIPGHLQSLIQTQLLERFAELWFNLGKKIAHIEEGMGYGEVFSHGNFLQRKAIMAYERFNANNSTMLLIDHQVGTIGWMHSAPHEEVKRNTLALAKAAKAAQMKVVLTSSMEDHMQGPLFPDLEEILPEAFAARIKRAMKDMRCK